MCLITFAGVSCRRKAETVERLAILPANLLVSDRALEWLKMGIPLVLQHDLRTAHSLIAGVAPDDATAEQNAATRVLRTSVESRSGGFHAESTLTDTASKKVLHVETVDAASLDALLPSLDQLAKKLDGAATIFPTRNAACWQTFASAETTSSPQQRAQFLQQAIRQDQNFGAGWLALVEMIVPQAHNDDLKHLVEEGKSHRNSFDAYDKAKFDVAMNRISGASPLDQVKAARAVVTVAPNDLDTLALLGTNQILNGDNAGGEQTLRKAAAINPTNVSLRVQLARALMEVRKFKEAELLFTGLGKLPAVYPELATCLLLEGDKARADSTFEQFVSTLQNDELRLLLRAGWAATSGDRKKAVELLLGAKFKTPNINTIALSEATVWLAMDGQYDRAATAAGLLNQSADPSQPIPRIAALLADKTSASADWEKKVQQTGLPDAVKQPLLGYGFFLRQNYQDAARVWQQVNDGTHGADLRARAMLASSMDHSQEGSAGKIAVLPFVPEFADLYSVISFTEMRRMTGKS